MWASWPIYPQVQCPEAFRPKQEASTEAPPQWRKGQACLFPGWPWTFPKHSVNLLNHRAVTASTFPLLLPLLHHHRHGSKSSLDSMCQALDKEVNSFNHNITLQCR